MYLRISWTLDTEGFDNIKPNHDVSTQVYIFHEKRQKKKKKIDVKIFLRSLHFRIRFRVSLYLYCALVYQLTITYSKLNRNTWKSCEIRSKFNKNTRMASMTSCWCYYSELWIYFTPFSSDSIVDFEQVNDSWDSHKFGTTILWYCLISGFIFRALWNFYNGVFRKINDKKPLNILVKRSIIDAWQVSEYATGSVKSKRCVLRVITWNVMC